MERPLILERYRPLTELGSGGFGSVVLAFDVKMARRVAIKRIPLPAERSARSVARASLAEARTAAMLNHPSIVTVYEWEVTADEALIVMEHVEGVSLADVLHVVGRLDTDEAAALAAALGDALAFAHANGVLHLDVKPDNVLIGRSGRIALTDFGIASLRGPERTARATGGTPGYMAPEHLRGDEVDDRADQWSFAALVFEALTGENPFEADTPGASLVRAAVEPPVPPSSLDPSLGPGLDLVLLTALHPDPEERYPSVADCTRALLDHLGDPELGRASLADIVSTMLEDDEDAALAEHIGLWDRLAPYSGAWRRAGAALASGWLAWAGACAFVPPVPARLLTVSLAALAGVLAPPLGTLLGLGILAVGIGDTFGALPGIAFALLATMIWAVWGRRAGAASFAWLAGPALAVARSALATPFLLGFAFEPRSAAISSALSALATVAASAASGESAPWLRTSWRVLVDPLGCAAIVRSHLGTIITPSVLLTAVTWGFAGALASVACRRATRTHAALGLVGATTLLAGALAVSAQLDGVPHIDAWNTVDAAGAFAVSLAAVALGPPSPRST